MRRVSREGKPVTDIFPVSVLQEDRLTVCSLGNGGITHLQVSTVDSMIVLINQMCWRRWL